MRRKSRRQFFVTLAWAGTLGLTSCGGDDASQATANDASAEEGSVAAAEASAEAQTEDGATSPEGSEAAAEAGIEAGDASPGEASPEASAPNRPNILLILADDLGYSDIGAFGGEIKTPNLDALAAEGRVLTDHHAAATCSPTRSMLFSGTDHHLAGLGSMAELLEDGQKGKPGYEGYLNEKALSIAELLRDSGYHTYMAGKWHLGVDDNHTPKSRGFESSFALLGGGGSHFAPVVGKPVPADQVVYRENGVITKVPEYFFSSNFYTDKVIEYIQANVHDGKPFLAYAAYTAPHWPLQAPSDYVDRYKGAYDEGYAVIRGRRIDRQKQLGIIPADFVPNPGLPASTGSPTWDQLTSDQKLVEARKMEVYAAVVENLDHNIGRIISYLKDVGQYDNTFIFFQSDNGAEGSAGFPDGPNTDNTLANLGRPLSNVSYGHRWAEVSATPFHLWKGFSSEGGVVVPAIARLPKQASKQAPFTRFTHVSDLLPTFLELAQAQNPGTQYQGHVVNPITGLSLLPVLDGRSTTLRAAGVVVADELFGRRYVRRDTWKATYIEPPWGTGQWALYDLSTDRAEAHDLAATKPDVVTDLSGQWDQYASHVGVVLPLATGMGAREGTP